MWQTISNLLLDISTLNRAFYELSFVTGAAGSTSKGARSGPPSTRFSRLGNRIPTTERAKHLPVVENRIVTLKEIWAPEALNEASNDSVSSSTTVTVSLRSARILRLFYILSRLGSIRKRTNLQKPKLQKLKLKLKGQSRTAKGQAPKTRATKAQVEQTDRCRPAGVRDTL